jgi:hypothetical protein
MKRILFAAILSMPVIATAQDSTTVEKKEVFSGSINYQSKLHYFGRTDSLKSSGLFPLLGYEFKNGLYAQGSAVFVQTKPTPLTYTGASVEVGYKFPESDHFEGNVFATKFFYNKESVLVQSALKAQTGVNLTYKTKIVNINGDADLKFSDKTDVGVTAGLDHLFIYKFENTKLALAFMPSATLYAGTQNFSNIYIKKTNVLGVPVTQQTTEKVQQFNILAYEFSVPVVLVVGKLNAFVIPSYVMPKNLVSTTSFKEKGENMLYVTAGVGFRL